MCDFLDEDLESGRKYSIFAKHKEILEDFYVNIMQSKINEHKLNKTMQHAKDIIDGKAIYKRFSPAEIQGLGRGGKLHVETSLITGRSTETRETQDERADRHESEVEAFAKAVGVWHENTEDYLSDKYGEPVNSGNESLVYYNDEKGTVIKTSHILQYRDLQDALDSITLNNARYPHAAIEVLGFGMDEEENFQIIKEQPYIFEGERMATQAEIDDFMALEGWKPDTELGLRGRYYNEEGQRINDITPKNVVLTPDGRIIPIDTIMHLNTPEFRGNRQTENIIVYLEIV